MTLPRIKLGDLRYNGTNQKFEAAVTLIGGKGEVTYACSLAAPIDTPYRTASLRLVRQALAVHDESCADIWGIRSHRPHVEEAHLVH